MGTKEWLVKAPQENTARQQEINKVTGRQGALQPSHAGTEGVAVCNQGKEGNLYSWTQTEEEVELVIPLSQKIPKGGQLNKKVIKVDFLAQTVTAKYNGEQLLDVKLYSKIDVDGWTWTLDGDNLIVTAEKTYDELWPRLELTS